MSLVLIVDDIPAFCEQYAYDLRRLGGYDTLAATGGAQAFTLIREHPVDCMILDLEMPGMDGFELLKRLRTEESRPPVIVYTGTGNYERCVRAIKLGAYSFIDKAEPMERVVREIENALQAHRLSEENRRLRQRVDEAETLLGRGPAIATLREEIGRLAPLPTPVLILGESGSGKELVAREIHRVSGRSGAIFLPVNCAALPEHLVESELFGHEVGAYTGATRMRRGAFEAASSGTLLLDEIGELSLPVQAKLLRVLEEKKVMRLGGARQVPVETRVLAATNRKLEEEVQAKRFREDLLYRINMHVIRVPALRERREDIPLLAERFLDLTCREYGRRPKTYDPEVIRRLTECDWDRNNVRELRNVVARMVILCEGERVALEHLPPDLRRGSDAGRESDTRRDTTKTDAGVPPAGVAGSAGPLKALKARAEREIVLSALERNDWRIGKTAEELGLSDHASLLKIMRRHGIKRRDG